MRQPMPISNPIPFSRNRLPHGKRRLHPALNYRCGLPGTACNIRFRLPLGDSVRQPSPIRSPIPFFRTGYHKTTAATRARGSTNRRRLPQAARGSTSAASCHTWQDSWQPTTGAFWGGVALAGGGGGVPQNRGEGGRWPLAVDTDFENSHKILHTWVLQNAMRNRLGCRPYSERRGDPHPRAVKVITCGAARRRRPAAIPSGRGRLRGIRADSGGSPHTR